MSKETSSRSTVIKNFRELGAHCVRIEDALGPGVPDLNISWRSPGNIDKDFGNDAWVEFKHVKEKAVPKRLTTPLKIGLTKEQQLWLDARSLVGGRCGVIICIEANVHNSKNCWVLYANNDGYDDITFRWMLKYLVKGMTLDDIMNQSDMRWTGDFKPMALVCLERIMGS